ncbi:hypothetical protein ASG75_09120 [Rhodanobacter sp. Soil772]|nr:hypothetical protein ASG75_09120 [Rhodanobacter sp. Soil772]
MKNSSLDLVFFILSGMNSIVLSSSVACCRFRILTNRLHGRPRNLILPGRWRAFSLRMAGSCGRML